MDMMATNVLLDDTRNNSNISHPGTLTSSRDWDEKPKLKFPKFAMEERYKMASLHLDKGWFVFDYFRGFLSFVQPYDIPIDLLADAVENRISTIKLISESLHVEAAFLGLAAVCCVLACIIPGTELWLACRPIRQDYKPSQHPGVLAFLLAVFAFILGSCMVTMIICNEALAAGIEKLPITVETALQDLKDYHTDTTLQIRKCLTRSLDVASEAILADLDNGRDVEKFYIAVEIRREINAARARIVDQTRNVETNSFELSKQLDSVRSIADYAIPRVIAFEHIRWIIGIASVLCILLVFSLLIGALCCRWRSSKNKVRPTLLCGVVTSCFVSITLWIVFIVALGIASNTEMLICRPLHDPNYRIIEAMLETRAFLGRRLAVPLKELFDVLCILLVFSLLIGALCCRWRSSKNKVRPTLLCGVVTSCFVSITLWIVFIVALGIASNTEMLICRPLHDPNYRIIEAMLETRAFLGRRLAVPLKELFEYPSGCEGQTQRAEHCTMCVTIFSSIFICRKCRNNEAAYPAFGLENMMKLEHLTAHWTWLGLSRAISNVKIDLKGLQILTPNLHQSLQDFLYAYGLNLTAHRIMIQGPILNKDLTTISDQLDNISRQLQDRSIARELQSIGITMRDLILRRVKPLMKFQDDLVYRLAILELKVQPLWRQVNQSISHLKTIQYYIDHQGEKIAQLKTKSYVDRMANYLDQWRMYVLSEMGTGVSKCRPLWDILEGTKHLLCGHILSPFNGFWFAIFVCAIVMIGSTPTAHILSLLYKKQYHFTDVVSLPTRSVSLDTNDDRIWQTPDPPPLPQSDW
ncbi:prominin-1 [Formica exsecta]|uniref:prominin-1 n=1 Tax=Formica exsecta TaxID=72781 RepID=UPI001141F7B0|nr:prominin-1 [Formica exsecta]